MLGIRKITDERETEKKSKQTKTGKDKEGEGAEAIVKRLELNDFGVHLT